MDLTRYRVYFFESSVLTVVQLKVWFSDNGFLKTDIGQEQLSIKKRTAYVKTIRVHVLRRYLLFIYYKNIKVFFYLIFLE